MPLPDPHRGACKDSGSETRGAYVLLRCLYTYLIADWPGPIASLADPDVDTRPVSYVYSVPSNQNTLPEQANTSLVSLDLMISLASCRSIARPTMHGSHDHDHIREESGSSFDLQVLQMHEVQDEKLPCI